MNKTSKRKSIFRLLIIRIFLLIIGISTLASVYIISYEIKNNRRHKEEKSKLLFFEVRGILGFISTNIESIAKIYEEKHELLISEFTKRITQQNAQNLNFNQVFKELNIDTSANRFYLIADEKIINSNNKIETGTNLYSLLDYQDSIIFHDQIMKGQIFKPKFVYNKSDKKFYVVSFYPMMQNRYIVGLKTPSSEFDKILELFKSRLQEITQNDSSILSINYWLYTNNARIPLITDSLTQFIEDNITGPDASRPAHHVNKEIQEKKIRIDHYFQKSAGKIHHLSGFSISIASDYTDQSRWVANVIRNRIILLLLSLIICFLIVYFSTKTLKLTLSELLHKTALIGGGQLNKRVQVVGNTEFTTLAEHFNVMVEQVEQAHKELKDKNEEILAQNEEITTQRDEIELQRNHAVEQKNIIEKQKANILDSILYAKRIQEAVLPEREYISSVLPESFVYYRPCSVVSGDFYWIKELDDQLIIVAADCTGHGVPGAFMSMLGSAHLTEIVNTKKITQPNLILNELREKIKYSLKQTGKDHEAQDGMEMTICTIDRKYKKMQFAAAMNPLVLVRNNSITVFEPDQMPVGVYLKDSASFTNHELELEKEDVFYMFSDGYADQFGGPKRRKFMNNNFMNLLLEISNKPMEEQMEELDKTFSDWKMDTKQIDDVLVMGFKVF